MNWLSPCVRDDLERERSLEREREREGGEGEGRRRQVRGNEVREGGREGGRERGGEKGMCCKTLASTHSCTLTSGISCPGISGGI